MRTATKLVTILTPTRRSVQGLYARTTPTPDTNNTIRPLAIDPNVANRMWSVGSRFNQLGLGPVDGSTYTAKVGPLFAGGAWQQLLFANNYLWATANGAAVKTSVLARSAQPAADGSGVSFTTMFDMASPPAGLTIGDNASLRNSCVAVSGANVYLGEYSGNAITGGPSLFYSPDSGATWSLLKQFSTAKHIHAVKIINSVIWVSTGDTGNSGLGLWSSPDGSTWTQRETAKYGINLFADTVGNTAGIIAEADGSFNYGPLWFPSQSASGTTAYKSLAVIPYANRGTMRSWTKLSNGNVLWVHSGESGAVGPLDTVFLSYPPYSDIHICETVASNPTAFGTLGDAVTDQTYAWFGNCRVTVEKYRGQA